MISFSIATKSDFGGVKAFLQAWAKGSALGTIAQKGNLYTTQPPLHLMSIELMVVLC